MDYVYCIERQAAPDEAWAVVRIYDQRDTAEDYVRTITAMNAEDGVYCVAYRVREWDVHKPWRS